LNAQVINKFTGALSEVLSTYFSVNIAKVGAPAAIPQQSALEPVTVLLEFTGDLVGHFVIGYTPETALNIARAMMMNPEHPELDEMSKSALSELGNMIGGMSSTGLTELGLACDLAPPLLIMGTNITVQFHVPVLVSLPISTSAGELKLSIGLKEAS
jgi:chemotaxis protein CheX